MDTFVILRRHGWRTGDDLDEAAARSAQIGDGPMAGEVRWIRSYVVAESDGGLGTVCVYEATSADALRRHAERAGLPADEVLPVADMVLMRADPEPVGR